MDLKINKEWFQNRAAVEGDLEIGAGFDYYTPPFTPGPADHYYETIIAELKVANTRMLEALEEIGCLEQRGDLQWWQVKAREAAGFTESREPMRETPLT